MGIITLAVQYFIYVDSPAKRAQKTRTVPEAERPGAPASSPADSIITRIKTCPLLYIIARISAGGTPALPVLNAFPHIATDTF